MAKEIELQINFSKFLPFDKFSLTLIQYLTLEMIYKEKKCFLSQVGEKMNIALSTATENITRLIKKKLVTKKRDDNDKRKVKIFLTKKGEKIIQELNKKKNEIIKEFHKLLDETEKKVLESAAKKIEIIKHKYFKEPTI